MRTNSLLTSPKTVHEMEAKIERINRVFREELNTETWHPALLLRPNSLVCDSLSPAGRDICSPSSSVRLLHKLRAASPGSLQHERPNVHAQYLRFLVHINPSIQCADVNLPSDFECRPDVLMALRGHSSPYYRCSVLCTDVASLSGHASMDCTSLRAPRYNALFRTP